MFWQWYGTERSSARAIGARDRGGNDAVDNKSVPPVIQRRASMSHPEPGLPPAPDGPPPDLRRTVTSAVMSPHDTVLEELHDQLRDLEMADQTQSTASTSRIKEDGSSPRADVVYDPFTGAPIGTLAPNDQEDTRDEMWTHLAKIRELQSEIAVMHSQMEGLGGGERIAMVERTGDDGEPENADEVKAAKEAEFTRLTDRFTGRKDAIDLIMGKLDTLSEAVTTFHSLRTPVLQFANPRGSFEDSTTASPVSVTSKQTLPDAPTATSTATPSRLVTTRDAEQT